MKTRCKMVCSKFEKEDEGSEVSFVAVVGDENNSENNEFFRYTPNGSLVLGIVNPSIEFVEGKEYYVDITLAE